VHTLLLKALAVCVLLLAVSFPATVQAQIDHPEREAILERMAARIEAFGLPLATLRQRANAGDYRAMYALSLNYQSGLDVPQSFDQADRWTDRAIQAAAEAMADGDADAMHIHQMLTRHVWQRENDEYVPDREVLRLSQLAADAGAAEAMHEVGRAHFLGRGTPENKAEALRWFELGALGGHCDSMTAAAVLRLEPPGQGAPDVARAVQWYRLAAEHPYACGNGANIALASIYSQGAGDVPKNHGEALRYLIRSAERGNPVAVQAVGFYYEKGLGVPVDQAEALRWFRLAGHASAEAARRSLAELGVPEPN